MVGAPSQVPSCALCGAPVERVLWRDAQLRVVAIDDADYPGYCRVIWQQHVREMCELLPAQSLHLWRVLGVVETGLRDILQPDKINLASLGNVVAHLHWHLIPRWFDDRCFPNPIWGLPRAGAEAPSQAAQLLRRENAERLYATLPQLLNAQSPW
jgi:diadenosine tetraphosphate (Ap4A) HIT family hydrolase